MKYIGGTNARNKFKKGTSIGRGVVKTSTMNKGKKRSHKRYRGQG